MPDITRYCHEKSVIEMFDFGKRYHFDEGAAKRMVDNMPLEWWVINLSDGFVPDFDPAKKFINVNEIVSTPLIAIWEGMHAYPWEGPPSVSMRGMGAIVFQSAMNPALDPAVASKMNQKNYFLVSRNYCNLSVRLGYHYAMIEAFISSLRTERYVTFRFKGGAADESRRVGRIELLAEILARFDFRVELTGDALAARVEKRTQNFLFGRLKVLGYLTIHTRQIDMVMADPVQYQRYRQKFILEIEEMLSHDK
jgi:pyruvate,water dikinase